MEKILSNKRTLVLFMILIIIIFFFLLFRLFYVPPTPTSNYFSKAGPNADVVPTIAPDPYGNGGQLDINSPIVKESEKNIEVLKHKLPYKDEFKSSTGLTVTVYITDRQISPSGLDVSVDGIDYLGDSNDPDYNKNRTAFLEAVDRLNKWVETNGADPSKIYFIWSNQKYVRGIILEWLNSR